MTTFCSAAHLGLRPRTPKARSRKPAWMKGQCGWLAASCCAASFYEASFFARPRGARAPHKWPGRLCSPGNAPWVSKNALQNTMLCHRCPPLTPAPAPCAGRRTRGQAGAGRQWGTCFVIGAPRPGSGSPAHFTGARPGQPARGRGAALAAKQQRPVEGAAPHVHPVLTARTPRLHQLALAPSGSLGERTPLATQPVPAAPWAAGATVARSLCG